MQAQDTEENDTKKKWMENMEDLVKVSIFFLFFTNVKSSRPIVIEMKWHFHLKIWKRNKERSKYYDEQRRT